MSRAPRLVLLLALGLAAVLSAAPASAQAALPPIGHVFVIVLENESASITFGPGSPAPYLSETLRAQGAYLPNYYATGHQSNDNYIAMISGQAPNGENQGDCQNYDDLEPGTIGSYGQAQGEGCIYPATVPTVADQMLSGGLTWRDYNEDMGATPSREAAECGHPGVDMVDGTQKATAADSYATRHNPFVYFHSIIDDTTLCDTHVVNLDLLPKDLSSAADTPNYVFITPNLCDDGHDSPCATGQPGGLAQADQFLRQWVPQITGSPAFKQQNGLLIITFDEAATSDTSSCCGEIPGPGSPAPGDTGPGGGDVGAVLLSPCIAPGTVSQQPYNHYTMLRSVEDLFGLPHIGYAQLPGESSFGSDVFTRACASGAPAASVKAPAIASSAAALPRVPVTWSATIGGSRFNVQVRRTSGRRASGWRTLLASTARGALRYGGVPGSTYQFRVQAISPSGVAGAWSTATTVVPTAAGPRGAHLTGAWHLARVRFAWERHALISSSAGATFTLRFVGGALAIIGERSRAGGAIRLTIDGRTRTIRLHAKRTRVRQIIYRAKIRFGRHRVTIRVLSGKVALEGLAITNRRR